jgi:hypothetical protein
MVPGDRENHTMRWKLALLVFVLLLMVASHLPAQETPSFKVIVHASNPVSTLNVKQVAQFFLKKESRWSHGVEALPIDLTADSPARESFSLVVLGKPTPAVKSYWQQMIFSGRGTPPMETSTEADVMAFVGATAGAIGYVSGETPLGPGVKSVALTS